MIDIHTNHPKGRTHEIKIELILSDNELLELTNLIGNTTHAIFAGLYSGLSDTCYKEGIG